MRLATLIRGLHERYVTVFSGEFSPSIGPCRFIAIIAPCRRHDI
jgi:hypothetical protein